MGIIRLKVLALLAATVAALSAGCAQHSADASGNQSAAPIPTGAIGTYTGVVTAGGTQNNDSGADPQVIPPRLVHLFVYRILVPIGAISDNEKFWRHVDEQVVDVATHDLLYKNGIRVGETPLAQWTELRKCIVAGPSSFKKSEVSGVDAANDELEISEPINFQYIFYFDSTNHLIGKSYDRCQNILGLSFIPSPRQDDSVRVSLCPIVRAQRMILQYTAMNAEQEVTQVRPERLYDLNLAANLPDSQVLIVAPSPDASFDEDCVGNRFLVQNGATEKMEMVLMFVAKPVPLDATDAALVVK